MIIDWTGIKYYIGGSLILTEPKRGDIVIIVAPPSKGDCFTGIVISKEILEENEVLLNSLAEKVVTEPELIPVDSDLEIVDLSSILSGQVTLTEIESGMLAERCSNVHIVIVDDAITLKDIEAKLINKSDLE